MATTTRQIPGLKETSKTVALSLAVGIGIGHWLIGTHDISPVNTAAQAPITAPSPTPHP